MDGLRRRGIRCSGKEDRRQQRAVAQVGERGTEFKEVVAGVQILNPELSAIVRLCRAGQV